MKGQREGDTRLVTPLEHELRVGLTFAVGSPARAVRVRVDVT